MNNSIIKIGTRDSKLAVWQAEQVQLILEQTGRKTELVKIKSPADLDLSTPLHEFGDTGIFTKMLDVALLENRVDIAVHSLKDYPTTEPEGVKLIAVLARAAHEDILVLHPNTNKTSLERAENTIATGSIRRQAQWKHRYPNHILTGLRGNVQTRLKKLEESDWSGAIFAKAGLERIGILPENHLVLNWMIPAPAQGVVGITCRASDADMINLLQVINHEETWLEATIEREFLNAAEGGCSAPIGAYAQIRGHEVELKAVIFEPDGSKKVNFSGSCALPNTMHFGRTAAEEALQNGGAEIMKKIKDERAS